MGRHRTRTIIRDRAGEDRRAVLLTVQRDRISGMATLYAGMNARVDKICANYKDAELDIIVGFLRRVIEAGHAVTHELDG